MILSAPVRGLAAVAVVGILILPARGFAEDPVYQASGSTAPAGSEVPYTRPRREHPNALYMATDALFARPVLLAFTLIGCGVYVVSLPFSLLGGNAVEAADYLVAGPARATFMRCLGCTVERP